MKHTYLDWCPRPINASQNRTFQSKISTEKLGLVLDEDSLCDEVTYCFRNDGFLIFSVDWKSNRAESSSWRIANAHFISHLIKENSGHSHFYNREVQGYGQYPFPSLSVDPIELTNTITPDKFQEILSNDNSILRLEARSFKHKNEIIIAALMIRNQYAQLFEKAKAAKASISGTTWSIANLNFRAYSWRWPLLCLIAICIPYAFLNIHVSDDQNSLIGHTISLVFNFSFESINQFWESFLIGLLPGIVITFILEISIKRRKILKAMRRTRGYLVYGNALSTILQGLIANCDHKEKFRNCAGFETGIELLNDLITVEEKKRTQTLLWLMAASMMSYGHFYSVIEMQFPSINKIIPILGLLQNLLIFL